MNHAKLFMLINNNREKNEYLKAFAFIVITLSL
jgi:hypothetical protein